MESAAGGFRLVLGNRYLLLIAGLIVLLNLVNTTGEYLVARLLTMHVGELAAAHPGFNKQAYIGAFSGDYQFWVNVTAFVAAGVRHLAAREVCGARGCAARAAAHRARRLRDHLGRRRLLRGPLDQDRRKRDGLLDHEHRPPAALAADQPRGEVQGEAGDRHLLHALRRRAVGRRRLRRRQRAPPQHPAVRHRQHGAGARVDRRRADDRAARSRLRSSVRAGFVPSRQPPRS